MMKGPVALRLVGAGVFVGVRGVEVSVGLSGAGLWLGTGDCSAAVPVGGPSTTGVAGKENKMHDIEKSNVRNRTITFRKWCMNDLL
jgi:hypothetical protein